MSNHSECWSSDFIASYFHVCHFISPCLLVWTLVLFPWKSPDFEPRLRPPKPCSALKAHPRWSPGVLCSAPAASSYHRHVSGTATKVCTYIVYPIWERFWKGSMRIGQCQPLDGVGTRFSEPSSIFGRLNWFDHTADPSRWLHPELWGWCMAPKKMAWI